ncbi:hypothetical protein BDK51DRAFT_31621 [Blyttiomyces helicus]|uniref:Uncharacterized protein n=1 Tax=Blyttiomyces helicus TaxID=388810 RepID=A0A4P9WP82_9FUNG|nr:hypothetical protein BDK51DRAFT_31621 [Blyttiomyces helicus]|eukprot:RKO94302.1 hypothetical protein BDK51DRAFT_31621 [Blyttiomyces helicus]
MPRHIQQKSPSAGSYPKAFEVLAPANYKLPAFCRTGLPRTTTLEVPTGGHLTPSAKRIDDIPLFSVVPEQTPPQQLPSRSEQRRGSQPMLLAAALHTSMSPSRQLGIASPEMFADTWRYGHGKLILMDCTFGICFQKVLLFVIIVIDENFRGVPAALFLFSAPLGN